MRTPPSLLCLLLVTACVAPATGSGAAAVSTLVPLPDARHGHRVEAVAGGLLAFGGFARGHDRTAAGRHTFFLADGAASWQRRADLARGRSFFGSVVIDGAAYAIGDDVERYDAERDRWSVICPAGQLPRSHFAAAAIGREIFVLGGYPLERSGFWVVDVDAGTVRAAEPPPGFEPGDHFHFLAALAGQLHVIGGLDAATSDPQLVHCVWNGESWRTLPLPPPGLWAKFGAGVVHGGELFVFGDFGGHSFAPGRGWRPRQGWGGLVAMPALVAVGDELWRLGGMAVEGSRRAPPLVYQPGVDRWR